MSQKILLITPPFTQLNTPYPATPYLKGFFNKHSIPSFQLDLSIETLLSLFSKNGLKQMFLIADQNRMNENSLRIYSLQKEYVNTIESVIGFLQGKKETLAQIIAEGDFLPQASRFNNEADLEWAFGNMGYRDKARYIATLYLEDLCDFITDCVDPEFGFSRYAEQIGRYASSFDELNKRLHQPESFIDKLMLEILSEKIKSVKPDIVALTIPFPGNLYSAFRCGAYIKENYPDIKIEMGGGFPNTELRRLSDPRVFEYTDFIILDDGELPLLRLIDYLEGGCEKSSLVRTFLCEAGEVRFYDDSFSKDIPFTETGTPDYSDLPTEKYLSVIEVANPMHKLWSDGRWNKLTFAHGCYWGKCAFCDGSLDYIRRYDPANASLIADRMEELMEKTGESGFHFVDEAAPPALMRDLAIEIIRRGMKVIWWTNVRFEKSFTADICRLLRASGCIAVSGGLEVASDRLLKLINKGVTVEQVAKTASNFTEAGIMVHAYLMYGFPTQTSQETVDSLEIVRQLFQAGIVQSGFWHRFAMTAHSPVGCNPEKYSVIAEKFKFGGFADNDRLFNDPDGCDHSLFGEALRKSLFNYMHGIGLEYPVSEWFDFRIPQTTHSPNLIKKAIGYEEPFEKRLGKRLLWLGGVAVSKDIERNKKGKKQYLAKTEINNKTEVIEFETTREINSIILTMLKKSSPDSAEKYSLGDFKNDISPVLNVPFEKFMNSEIMKDLLETGLLMI